MKILCYIILTLLLAGSANAQVTISNFDGTSSPQYYNQVSRYDVNQNLMDAHDGMMLQVSGTIYEYGTAYGCGFVLGQTSSFCGINVYTSTDINNRSAPTRLFDATTSFWQNRCGTVGCFRPHVIFNVANNNYVLWFNQASGATTPSADSYFVFVCATPTGGCIQQADPVGLSHTAGGDFSLFVDTTGIGYIAYTSTVTRHIYVERLNASYTDSTGTFVDTGATGEGVMMFARSGTYYVGFGALCSYCSSTDTSYVSASAPLGTYGSSTTLNSSSCGGQSRSVDLIAGTYVYSSDLWNRGWANEALADIYYQPLTFTGTAINSFACNNTVTISGLTPNPPAPPSPAPDQTSVGGTFYSNADITASQWRMQTFVPTKTLLTSIKIPMGQNCLSGSCTPSGLNAPITVKLTTVDGSLNPLATLAALTLTSAQLTWSQVLTSLAFNVSLTPGTTYAMVFSGAGTANSGSLPLYSGATNPYPAGVERFSTNGGSSWTTEGANALMFSTFAPSPPIGPGRLFR